MNFNRPIDTAAMPSIGFNRAIDEALIHAVHGFDHRPLGIQRIDGKHDSRWSSRHRRLYDDGHRTGPRIQLQLTAVEQRRIGP